MESLFLFLLMGGLAFFMMRGGSCGGHAHGGHGAHRGGGGHTDPNGSADHTSTGDAGTPAQIAMVPDRDPVCGMKLAPDEGYGKMHSGQAYRFCSRKCLDAFEAEPEQYARVPGPEELSEHRHGHHG